MTTIPNLHWFCGYAARYGILFLGVGSLLPWASAFFSQLELLSHFRAQYLAGAVLLLVLTVFLRQRASSGLAALLVVLNGVMILPYYTTAPAAAATAKEPASLRVMLSNVRTGKHHFARALACFRKENPDILVLQEIDWRWREQMEVLHTDYTFRHNIPRGDNFGIAVYSKVALEDIRTVCFQPDELPGIQATAILHDGRRVTILSTHPLPPVGRRNMQSRNQQLAEVAAMARNTSGPLILIGDLNITSWSPNFASLLDGTRLRDARQGFGVLPSWPTYWPLLMIPIDHCLVSSEIGVLDFRVSDNIGSDHLPIIVDLTL